MEELLALAEQADHIAAGKFEASPTASSAVTRPDVEPSVDAGSPGGRQGSNAADQAENGGAALLSDRTCH
jgi:hypothetical protein